MTDSYAFGVDRLISDEVYIAAYPLHDVSFCHFSWPWITNNWTNKKKIGFQGEIRTRGSMRNLLSYEWASISKWYRYQPVDYIKDYFGVKIGLYFAWLGYYTYMLMLASIFGICCFLYSWFTLDQDKPSQDICSGALDIKMCPLCDHWCDYWKLEDGCFHAKVTYLFNNSTTIVFAVFMSFWGIPWPLTYFHWITIVMSFVFQQLYFSSCGNDILLKLLIAGIWRDSMYTRNIHVRSIWVMWTELAQEWEVNLWSSFRFLLPARLQNVKKIRIDYVTHSKEPQPPFWRMKLPATVFSFTVVILLVALAVAAVLGVVLYRMSMLVVLTSIRKYQITNSGVIFFTTATAASINLCLIVVFNWVSGKGIRSYGIIDIQLTRVMNPSC